MKLSLFVACAPGLEPIVAEEVRSIAGEATMVAGGVETQGDETLLARILVSCGAGNRVLVRVASFFAKNLEALEKHVARLPWSGWLLPGVPRAVHSSATRTRINHARATEERVLAAIHGRLGDTLPVSNDPALSVVTIHVRIVDDRVTISLDATGDALHRRGYRLDPRLAPLREDIGHALVLASGFRGTGCFVDPMCGSGTIAIEAARLAKGIAPGALRSFAAERTKLLTTAQLDAVKKELAAREHASTARIIARDRDPAAIRATAENAARAGVADAIELQEGALSLARAQMGEVTGAFIVTNPPWGERLSHERDLRPLYRGLGQLCTATQSTLTIAAHDRRLAYSTGVPMKSAFLTELGGLKVSAMTTRPL